MRCGTCGFEGAGEEVVTGMQVCPSCGALAAEGIDAVFDRTVFRRARRLVGRLPDRVSPGLFDAADRPLARGMRTTRGARMALAWIAGAVTLTALLLLWPLAGGGALLEYVLAPLMLWASLAVVAWLRPCPTLVLFSTEGEPRALLRVVSEGRRGFRSRLRVEGPEGAALGTLTLDRLREQVFALSGRPWLRIEPSVGAPIEVRRVSSWRPGWVFERGGEAIASYGLNPGAAGRDELELPDPDAVDPRLLVAATLIARP